MTEDIIEVHHKNGNRNDNYRRNLELLHGHCHDQLHAAFATTVGITDNDRFTEEPCARKPARTVLEQREEG
jgi:RNA-directed DNA polymerase